MAVPLSVIELDVRFPHVRGVELVIADCLLFNCVCIELVASTYCKAVVNPVTFA